MSDPTPPKSNPTPQKKQLWELDPKDLDAPQIRSMDGLIGSSIGVVPSQVQDQIEAALAKEERKLKEQIVEERRAARWRHSPESVKFPPELRQDPAVQTAIIVMAAQEIKVNALRKGMADKYKDAPEIHADANGPEDVATRLQVGGRVVRASKGDVALIDGAEEEEHHAGEDARKAVANTASKLGIKADQVNEITQVLEVEARQNMQGNAPAAAAAKAPERAAPSR